MLANIPFKSGNGPNQWLTEGFYFWTDSPYWAKKWLPNVHTKVIGEFNIELCPNSELLDLVGNVLQQLEFVKLKNTMLDNLKQDQSKQVTVNQIIQYFRKRTLVFPYHAIKAEDGRCVEKIKFIDPKLRNNREEIALVTRQQMCVFDTAKHRIKLCGFEEPQTFADNYSA